MKWNDFDVNKNAFPETIRIIVDWLWFTSQRWDNISDKNKFIEQNLQPLLTGTFREPKIKNNEISYPSPALGTLVRNLGFIDDEYNISPLVKLIATGELSIQEYSLIILSKQRGWINDEPKVNFLALLCLYLQKNNYCNINEDTLLNLSKVDGYSLEINTTNTESNRNDILYNYIKSTGLFEEITNPGEKRLLKLHDSAKDIIDFVAEYYDKITVAKCTSKNERYLYYGNVNSGIFDLYGLPLPTNWAEYYPNLLNPDKLNSKLIGIKSSTFDGDLVPVILYGPPGTGKTYTMQKDYLSKYDELQRFVTTFHQSFSYEEFVEGLKPELNGEEISYHIEKGIFFQACERAAITAGYCSLSECIRDSKENRQNMFDKAIKEKRTVLLCIDEINRGNVASIFGDLISLIEPSKRLGAGELEMMVKLPYSKENFGVPSNLMIVGTMNTADRSIQLLDSALRRRFKFKELLPQYDNFEKEEAKQILININARVRCLLNKDNQIGHSYLMKAKEYSEILSAMVDNIIPLLEEYFYNDMDKVRFVVGDKDNSEYNFYVEDKEAKKAYELFLNDALDEEDQEFYTLNPNIAIAIKGKNEEECKKYLEALLKADGE